MTMQRRHFELIAEAIRTVAQEIPGADESADFIEGYDTACREISTRFASRLAATNPNFNRARFLRACGVED